LKLREALKEKITSTSTIITGKFTGVTKTPNEWHFELPTQYVQWIQEVTIINNRSEEYISYIASETLHALRLYEKMKKDRLSSLVFRRIEPLLDVFITELKNSIENKSFDQEKYANMHAVLNGFFYTLSQRTSDIDVPYIFSVRNSNLEIHGGISRVIYALEAIPISLLNYVGLSWKGFCVFGYAPESRRYDFGMLSIPRQTIRHPEDWFSISHEVGHEAGFLKVEEIFGENEESLKGLLNEGLSDEAEKKQMTFLLEVHADMFDFAYGFGEDWKLYISTVWSFLLGNKKEKLREKSFIEYLQRTFAVYVSKRLKKSRDPSDNEMRKMADDFLSDFINILCINENELAISKLKNELVDAVSFSLKGIRMLTSLIEKPPIKGKLITKELKEGTVVFNVEPILVLRSLLRIRQEEHRPCTFQERLTAIMSLLHYTYLKSV